MHRHKSKQNDSVRNNLKYLVFFVSSINRMSVNHFTIELYLQPSSCIFIFKLKHSCIISPFVFLLSIPPVYNSCFLSILWPICFNHWYWFSIIYIFILQLFKYYLFLYDLRADHIIGWIIMELICSKTVSIALWHLSVAYCSLCSIGTLYDFPFCIKSSIGVDLVRVCLGSHIGEILLVKLLCHFY